MTHWSHLLCVGGAHHKGWTAMLKHKVVSEYIAGWRTQRCPETGWIWKRVRNCFGNSFFFFRDFFFFGWGWFWGCPGSFLGKPRGERQVRAGFSGHLGVVLGLSRLRSGETSGEMQVPSRFGHKKLLQKANCPVHFCFLCVFIYVDVCVCVCDRVCSMCFLSVVALIFHSMHFFSCICNLSI